MLPPSGLALDVRLYRKERKTGDHLVKHAKSTRSLLMYSFPFKPNRKSESLGLKFCQVGAPGWLHWLSVRVLISGSWVQNPSWASTGGCLKIKRRQFVLKCTHIFVCQRLKHTLRKKTNVCKRQKHLLSGRHHTSFVTIQVSETWAASAQVGGVGRFPDR